MHDRLSFRPLIGMALAQMKTWWLTTKYIQSILLSAALNCDDGHRSIYRYVICLAALYSMLCMIYLHVH
jgi:hypothetical protein